MTVPLRNSTRDTILYLQSILREAARMAQAERCDMLHYLVEMAYVEASDILRGERPLRNRTGRTGDGEHRADDPRKRSAA